jgi:hypothetical protein
MTAFTELVAKNVGRHFVSLSCVQQPPGGEPRVLVFSGFVVEIGGEWFYVTAGHILRDLRAAIESGSTFDVWRLGDQTTAGAKFRYTAIPYDFSLHEWAVVEDAEQGLDYAAVHLGGLYRLQLEAGGIVAIEKRAWGDHVSPADHWALAGIPSESVAYDGETVISARFVFVKLVPEGQPPPAAGKRADNQFYARLLEGSEEVVRDVDGMSGGPVVEVRWTEGGWRYGVIGVQSAWYRSIRTVAVCPFSSFGLAIEEAIAQVLRALGREG